MLNHSVFDIKPYQMLLKHETLYISYYYHIISSHFKIEHITSHKSHQLIVLNVFTFITTNNSFKIYLIKSKQSYSKFIQLYENILNHCIFVFTVTSCITYKKYF